MAPAPAPQPSVLSSLVDDALAAVAELRDDFLGALERHGFAPLPVLFDVGARSPLAVAALVLALYVAGQLALSLAWWALGTCLHCVCCCGLWRRLWRCLCCRRGGGGGDAAAMQPLKRFGYPPVDAAAAALLPPLLPPPQPQPQQQPQQPLRRRNCRCFCGCFQCLRPLFEGSLLERVGCLALLAAALSSMALAGQHMNARLDVLAAGGSAGWQFSQAEIAAVAHEARERGGTPAEMIGNVTQILLERYPGIVCDTEWVFIRAGGWMGSFRLLYASTSEYVLLFGTAVDTSGHSGRYWARIEDTLLSGRFVQWAEGDVAPIVHLPGGATVIHERFAATGVQWDGGTWMLEHACGAIPSTLPFALGDVVLSAQDFYAAYRAIAVYSELVLDSALHGRF